MNRSCEPSRAQAGHRCDAKTKAFPFEVGPVRRYQVPVPVGLPPVETGDRRRRRAYLAEQLNGSQTKEHKIVISVLFVYNFPASLGPETHSNGPSSKNGAERL